ncbi:MAG: hypothetical protein Q9220_004310 [cf. Caloplaca sp. 1 TL-2023]
MAPIAANLASRSTSDCSETRHPPLRDGVGEAEQSHIATEENEIYVIDIAGDLLLHVHYGKLAAKRYRVSVSAIRSHSSYFDALLDGSKFQEGATVQTTLKALRRTHTEHSSLPLHDLPTVTVQDVRIGPSDSDIGASRGAFELFLRTLHERVDWMPRMKRLQRTPMILASFAHYAERFAATSFVSQNIRVQLGKRMYERIETSASLKENEARQKLYAGLILGWRESVDVHSALLIIWGSSKWFEETESTEEYPWDYLGGGIEGRSLLRTRRVSAKNDQRNFDIVENASSILYPLYKIIFFGSITPATHSVSYATTHHRNATPFNSVK